MSLKELSRICILWFLTGMFFGGALFGIWAYRHGKAEIYERYHDLLEEQTSYQAQFESVG